MAFTDMDDDGILAALGFVILFQLGSESMSLHPYDSVDLRIEILLAAQPFDADRIFLWCLACPGLRLSGKIC